MGKNKERYSVIVSAEAEAMLTEHAIFLAKVSPGAAEQLVEDYLELVDSLETMPTRFTAFAHNGYRLDGYYKALFAKRYLAIFCVEGRFVYLDYIVDCRQDSDALLKGLLPS